jgi:putative transposase
VKLPARSPDLNAFAQRWVRSVKEECVSKLTLFGEGSVKRALRQFLEHYHLECPHQGKGNVLLIPHPPRPQTAIKSAVLCTERLGGLLKYYCRAT